MLTNKRDPMIAPRNMNKVFIHQTAEVSVDAKIGSGTKIWNNAQVREGAVIGENCIIGKDVYIDSNVIVGSNCKIQNGCSIYRFAKIGKGVFLGPGVIITNDKYPRAIGLKGDLKESNEWRVGIVLIKEGASLGARAVVLPDVVIGKFAMIGAGSVVTKNILNFELAVGIPARRIGFVCYCGVKVDGANLKSKRFILKRCTHND